MPRVRLILFRKSEALQRLERRRRARLESRMSLRIRFILLVVALVAVVAVALSVLYLDNLVRSLANEAIERGQLASRQVSKSLEDRINQQSTKYQAPATAEDTKNLWHQIVSGDPELNITLLGMMAPFPNISEINVADENGKILASSNPQRIGKSLTKLQDFLDWSKERLRTRVVDVATRREDWQIVSTLGDRDQIVFKIQVVTSSVLLKSALLPELQRLAAVSGGSFLAVILLTVLSTNLVLRPLKRIEQTIDRIVQGREEPAVTSPARKNRAREFAVVENKLDLLGQQFRGAREDASELRHNVDKLIERLATQLDVATRLAAISRLTGGVAHEIKNPLNAMALHLEVLRSRLDTDQPELDVIAREIRRLDTVVKTFLNFNRPVELQARPLNLATILVQVLALVSVDAQNKNIELETAIADKLWLNGDPDLLQQAILN